jgi:hypothetical protein
MMKHEFEELVGITFSQENFALINYVYMHSDRFPHKAAIAAFYKEYDMRGMEAVYDDLKKGERIAKESEEKPTNVSQTGTHMMQEEYLDLEASAQSKVLPDAEAVVLINGECGFEASKIEILREAEIDVSDPDSCYVKTTKVPRSPVYAATDWNYVRFNVRCGCGVYFYELINGQLYQVML